MEARSLLASDWIDKGYPTSCCTFWFLRPCPVTKQDLTVMSSKLCLQNSWRLYLGVSV